MREPEKREENHPPESENMWMMPHRTMMTRMMIPATAKTFANTEMGSVRAGEALACGGCCAFKKPRMTILPPGENIDSDPIELLGQVPRLAGPVFIAPSPPGIDAG